MMSMHPATNIKVIPGRYCRHLRAYSINMLKPGLPQP
jgi:hypothetical protein